MITLTVDDKLIEFDDVEYFKTSKGIKREDLPQINAASISDELLTELKRSGMGIVTTSLPIKLLKPMQNAVDFTKIQIDIAKYGVNDDFERKLIISNDLYVLDGHHQLVRWLMTNPEFTFSS